MKDYGRLLAGRPGVGGARRCVLREVPRRQRAARRARAGRAGGIRCPMVAAYHDACHLGHAQGVRAQPRELLAGIPELEIREIADADICCGSAGIYNLVKPEPARELGDRKAANILATGAEPADHRQPGLPDAGRQRAAPPRADRSPWRTPSRCWTRRSGGRTWQKPGADRQRLGLVSGAVTSADPSSTDLAIVVEGSDEVLRRRARPCRHRPAGAARIRARRSRTQRCRQDHGGQGADDPAAARQRARDRRRARRRCRSRQGSAASIGLAGQSAAIVEELGGRENLEFDRAALPPRSRRGRRRGRPSCSTGSGSTEAAERRAKTYSGGMMRRLDLAASLVARPRVLFLDEPTTGLDPRARNDMWEVIRDLVAAGTTLLLTTQYLEEADELADNIVVFDRGKVIAEGTADDLKDTIGGDVVEFTVADAAQRDKAVAGGARARRRRAWRSTPTATSRSGPAAKARRCWSRWCGRLDAARHQGRGARRAPAVARRRVPGADRPHRRGRRDRQRRSAE